jgi:hypothetical protein
LIRIESVTVPFAALEDGADPAIAPIRPSVPLALDEAGDDPDNEYVVPPDGAMTSMPPVKSETVPVIEDCSERTAPVLGLDIMSSCE